MQESVTSQAIDFLSNFTLKRTEFFGLQTLFQNKFTTDSGVVRLGKTDSELLAAQEVTLGSGESHPVTLGSSQLETYTAPHYSQHFVASIYDMQTNLLPAELSTRLSSMTAVERRAIAITQSISAMVLQILRAKELQARYILRDGKIPFTRVDPIDFKRDVNNVMQAATSWLDFETSNPLADLTRLSRQIVKASGRKPDMVIMGSNALDAFLDSASLMAKLDNRRIEIGAYKGTRQLANGLEYAMTVNINAKEVNIYGYSEAWQPASGGELEPYIDPNEILMLNSTAPMMSIFANPGVMDDYKLTNIRLDIGGDQVVVFRENNPWGTKVFVTSRPLLFHPLINSTGRLIVV